MIAVGGVIVIAAAIYWLTRFDVFATTVFYGLLFTALSVLSIAMAFTGSAKAWLMNRTPAPPCRRCRTGDRQPVETVSPDRSSLASTLTVCPSRISPASRALARVSPIAVCTSRRSGRAPYSGS